MGHALLLEIQRLAKRISKVMNQLQSHLLMFIVLTNSILTGAFQQEIYVRPIWNLFMHIIAMI